MHRTFSLRKVFTPAALPEQFVKGEAPAATPIPEPPLRAIPADEDVAVVPLARTPQGGDGPKPGGRAAPRSAQNHH